MRRSGKVGLAAGGVVAALAAYATLDVYDVVPGVLTRAAATRPAVPVPGRSTVGPSVAPPRAPTAPDVAGVDTGPEPGAASLKARIQAAQKAVGLTSKVTMTVRDATTGTDLYDQGAGTAMTPASTTKLLTAWAISHTLPLEGTFTTKVVSAAPGSMVLVAGGDTCLNPKAGNPNAVCGRAGVGDLATQIAAGLKKQGLNSVRLAYDASYAPGPATAPGWGQDLLDMGFTTRIAMLGLSTQHAESGPAVANPDASTTAALATALRAKGIAATVGAPATAPVGAATVASVQSAPLLDQLGYALQESDNAMIESLARQAAYRSGTRADSEAALTRWLLARLAAGGFDLTGVKLADVCGLSDGTTLTARLLGDLLVGATSGKDPQFAPVLTRLAVGGWSGTLGNRYGTPATRDGAGWVRAKTGSLPSVNSLAGTVLDVQGRLLVFAIISNGPQPQGPTGARAALDTVVTAIHECGCP
ncbi:D-alanyl-D-alanine carboxypeptidase/D-alanyl-D-alanine endopeptidase [Allobranchiibius huperziae]|uniref:D-alanyl-D-alanine carboxypeptidase/D-alanyl-D-alanine-endopeptidase (Penicillin-binding protein 4) n=1 Tax=Allobranchiibius huperziae TaxID=1874116 RepID=A0A853DBV5_9MICO|nr:D-alanyl-D-alanine carboxypeptidase/D-alanyl-D-alanine-endopeptidase [Allobranchiibius huperziae]NYJ73459.1 D-alanyl-D-alanine carboxypeptidase/D-alanyl-D-alanine-endopeptidase (penicillin-binding protein 4) [Allobranchiibius huperziae]